MKEAVEQRVNTVPARVVTGVWVVWAIITHSRFKELHVQWLSAWTIRPTAIPTRFPRRYRRMTKNYGAMVTLECATVTLECATVTSLPE